MSKDTKIKEFSIDERLAKQILDQKLFKKHNIECSERLWGALDCFADNWDEWARDFILKNKLFQKLSESINQNNENGEFEDTYSIDNLQKIKNYLGNMPEYKEGFWLTHDYFGETDVCLIVDYIKHDLCLLDSIEDFSVFLSKIIENKSVVAKNFDITVDRYFVIYINTTFDSVSSNLNHSVQIGYQQKDPSIMAEVDSIEEDEVGDNIDNDSDDDESDDDDIFFDKFISIWEYTTKWNKDVIQVLKALGEGDDIFKLFDIDPNVAK